MRKTAINAHSWHYKIYMIGVSFWQRFTERDNWEGITLNHCLYIRMFAYLFFIIIPIHAFVYLSPLWIPYALYSIYGGIVLLEMIAIVVGVVVVCILGVLFNKFFKDNSDKLKKSLKNTVNSITTLGTKKLRDVEDDNKGSTLWEIFTSFLQDKHNNICRPIDLIGDKEKL